MMQGRVTAFSRGRAERSRAGQSDRSSVIAGIIHRLGKAHLINIIACAPWEIGIVSAGLNNIVLKIALVNYYQSFSDTRRWIPFVVLRLSLIAQKGCA
jgi:hypothetical protein